MKNYFIFDLDGTLYRFDDGKSNSFRNSGIFTELTRNRLSFVAKKFNLSLEESESLLYEIDKEFNDETSIGLEKKYDIDRYEYFENVWSMNPADYIKRNDSVKNLFDILNGRAVILTSAPRIWAESVLRYFDIYDNVRNFLFTGEPDLRKPNPDVFRSIIKYLNARPENVYSIGDQEYSDIIPAKIIGMKTIIIGSESEEAHYKIRTIDELKDLLLREGLL